ncbi:MAG TPA: M20/M25/M40 family metallo-hydrolase [Gaiella sp.]|nr:M20/M25/M40 family metallo-hydrolase [Gaiella sp.]
MSPSADPIAADAERLVEEWRAACRIPSVSGEREPIEEMAAWVEQRVARRFDRVVVERTPDGVPIVLGELRGTGPGRLVVYSHYDVVPAGDPETWDSDPFDAELREGAVYARGTCDDKADVTARLQAIDLWLDAHDGAPPVTVLWVCEGAEEVGSPGLAAVLERHADWLSAGDCLWESFVRRDDGRPEVAFGCRGLLAAELSVRLLEADQHAAFSPVLRSAPWTLTRALASLVDERGDVLVDGFLDDVAPPSPAAADVARRLVPPGAGLGPGGVSGALPGRGDEELALRLSYTPNANISALAAGDAGSEGAVVPAAARARVEFHLVPEQEPADVEAKVRRHLDTHGFGDVELRVTGRIRPAPGVLGTPLGDAALAAAAAVYGDPVVYPQLPGAGPARVMLDVLGATTVSPAGTTRLTSGLHGPNEHGAVADYLDHVRFTLRLLEELSQSTAA